MRNSPGMLVQNDRYKMIEIDQDTSSNGELEHFRYRLDRCCKEEKNNLTSYGNNRYGAKPVWKFRPLDDEKQKKVIKIEDKPVRRLQQPQQQSQLQPQYYRPYSPYTMTPMPMTPMVPVMPVAPLMSPGMMYQYPLYSY